jgi:chromosome segregation ATPase
MTNNNKIEKKLEALRKEFKDEVRRAIGVAIEHFEKQTALVAEHYSTLRENIERLEERIDVLEERMKAVEETLSEHSKILREYSRILSHHTKILEEHSRILEEHSIILQEHTKILQEIRFELKTRVSYNEFVKLLNRVANLEKKVQQLSKKK